MSRVPSSRAALAALAATLFLAACGSDVSDPQAPSGAEARGPVALRSGAAALGRAIFFDQDLSLKRNQSCSSCHDPAWGFSSPNPRINATGAVMFGSVRDRFGNRRPPSAAYATPAPVLFYNDEDGTYVGGNFWDGRATGARLGVPAAEQALGPFVNPVEQALPDQACAVYRAAFGRYRHLYRDTWGRAVDQISFPSNTDQLCEKEGNTVPLSAEDRVRLAVEYDNMGRSVAAYEHSPEVNAYSSKHDAVLAGAATFTPREAQGFALYVGKANCAACHPNDGARALFTDYTYDNIGVPANPRNPARLADPLFRDLGVGGFFQQPGEYGKMKVPTLRNLDRRGAPNAPKSFMHNGAFKSLEQVVHFYNTRDVLPACESISAPRFGENCWPAPEVTENVNTDELGNLGLTPDEEAAVVAYLKTLSDGWVRRN
ncbi:MAG: cytochrome c peroxidase [Gemmatimonadales bacterium]